MVILFHANQTVNVNWFKKKKRVNVNKVNLVSKKIKCNSQVEKSHNKLLINLNPLINIISIQIHKIKTAHD